MTPQLLTFLKQLRKNDNREWFQKNKDSYDPTLPPHPGVAESFTSMGMSFSPVSTTKSTSVPAEVLQK